MGAICFPGCCLRRSRKVAVAYLGFGLAIAIVAG
jgi:hypothetical protein